ncbi:MAG: hypothetical protein V8T87_09765 [Victivallales bacterium]
MTSRLPPIKFYTDNGLLAKIDSSLPKDQAYAAFLPFWDES